MTTGRQKEKDDECAQEIKNTWLDNCECGTLLLILHISVHYLLVLSTIFDTCSFLLKKFL